MHRHLHRWLPQSLLGRCFLALCVALAVALGVMLLLVQQDQLQLALRAGGVADNARRIAGVVHRLERLPAAERQREIDLLLQRGVSINGMPPDVAARRAEPGSGMRSYETELRRQLGGEYRISVVARGNPEARAIRLRPGVQRAAANTPPPASSAPPAQPPRMASTAVAETAAETPPPLPDSADWYQITIRPPHTAEDLTFLVDPPRVVPWIEPRILWQMAILATLIALAMYVITRSITRPLADLATAAAAVGGGGQWQLPERGTVEVRQATRAFNAMQDRLRRYVDNRTQLLAGMSHDLRTPLTRLRLRAAAIEDPALRARFDHDLDEMQQLVQGTLALFKGLHSHEPFEPVDLGELLREVRGEFLDLYADVRIAGNAQHPLRAQRLTIKRCLTNLIDNACKYGHHALVQVTELPQRQSVEVRVQDDGPGLPPEELERVFEPFYRVEPSRSRESGGAGLGLAIARDVVQTHGGTLTLANRAAGGLEAILVLPWAPPGASQPSAARAA